MTARWQGRLTTGVTVLAAAVWALPMLWVVILSLKPNDVLRESASAFLRPYPLTFENYLRLIQVSETPRWLLNSFVVALSTTVLTLVLSSMAGYALARIPFRGSRIVSLALLAGMMIPGQAVLLPLHRLFADWNLHNTYAALVLPSLAVPFGALLMKGVFEAVPRDYEEAAALDHASRWQVFVHVMLPLARPALTTLGVFTFLAAWNDFFWPLVSATDTDFYTITIGLSSLQGNFAQSEGLGFLMATAVFAGLPLVVVYLVFQRHIARGIAFGTGK
jgi:multiple sugar transport system permease protein